MYVAKVSSGCCKSVSEFCTVRPMAVAVRGAVPMTDVGASARGGTRDAGREAGCGCGNGTGVGAVSGRDVPSRHLGARLIVFSVRLPDRRNSYIINA